MNTKKTNHNLIHFIFTILYILIKNLPYFLVGVGSMATGFMLFNTIKTALTLIIGTPLILVGLSLVINYIHEAFSAVLDFNFSKTHCPLCLESLSNTKPPSKDY